MIRLKWLAVILLALATAASAARRPPKAKPKNGRWLDQKKGLWYLLNVPKPYDPKQHYPLVVAVSHREDRATEAHANWSKDAQLDQIFLATLNLPPGFKDDKNAAIWRMTRTVLKEYENIDRKTLALFGVDGGADAALQFLAAYPRVFRTAVVMNPRTYPDLSKVNAGGTNLLSSSTKVHLTYNPQDKDQKRAERASDALAQLRRRRIACRRYRAVPEGDGKPAEDERKLALKVLRSGYSDEKRKLLAAAWQKETDEIAKKKADDAKKLADARAELEGKTKKPGTQPKADPKQETDPDMLWLKANQLQNEKKDYAAAIEVYERLLEVAPDSDYAAEARKRIKQLKGDPRVRETIADQGASADCRKWLSLAGNYARAGMKDKAILYYQKIVDAHPDTSFAATAREALKKLREGS